MNKFISSPKNAAARLMLSVALTTVALFSSAQYKPVKHRALLPGEIPVTGPGFYGEQGRTYVLTQDVVSERSAIFLGKDVTLDLNGYRIVYTAGNYDTLKNSGFETGLEGWDLSKAPGAKRMNTIDIHTFVGEKLLSLDEGDEVRSAYVNLPLAQRSYVALVGITGRHYHDPKMKGDLKNEMKMSVYVEDEAGNNVEVRTTYADGEKISAPVLQKSPRLGGGYIYAHLNGLPAGKYRLRIKADTDVLIDEVNILPAMDVGIGVVGRTHAFGHYDHLYGTDHSAFFDYTADAKTGKPVSFIEPVKGSGIITIKNGVVEQANRGAISWGIQSTADDVHILLDNVHFIAKGVNSTAADIVQATINNCRFEVENPFLINRHGSSFYAVDIRGDKPSEVSYSEFYGGQGCLVFKGKHSSIHHNFFANNQAVTNHYSIMAMGDSSRVYNNTIKPIRGSGIEIYQKKYIDIFNNDIDIRSSAPTCEYGREEYSANAIRIADYNAPPGSPKGAYGNRVFNNRIKITAINFEKPEPYVPLSWAVFYSASGGDNDIFGNDIEIVHTAPASKALATAFFITGGTQGFGGNFFNNRVRSNVPAFWIAGKYGGTIRTKITNNVVIKTEGALPDYKPFRMGFDDCKGCIAKEVVLENNEIINDTFGIKVEGKGHSYLVKWNLKVEVKDARGNAAAGKRVQVWNGQDSLVLDASTNEHGIVTSLVTVENVTPELSINANPFRVKVDGKTEKFTINSNRQLSVSLSKKKK